MNEQECIKINIELEEVGARLDVFVSSFIPEFSRSRVQQLIKSSENILVNKKASKSSYRLKHGDEIVIISPKPEPLDLKAENIPLDIRYEDENMLVVNKPAGMLTHPTSIEREHTLVNALLYYCKGSLSGINGVMRPGIVHRLDRDTSGLLMIAKNDFAHKCLSEQVRSKSAIRQYLTIVLGVIKEDEGVIDLPIDRHLTQRHKMGVVEGGKPSVTHWKVLERLQDFTFVEATLKTGRTHQIRVHLSHKKHPVAGDPLYGGHNLKYNLKGQVLQSYKLSFMIPGSEKIKTIELEPEDDVKKLLKVLKQK